MGNDMGSLAQKLNVRVGVSYIGGSSDWKRRFWMDELVTEWVEKLDQIQVSGSTATVMRIFDAASSIPWQVRPSILYW